MAFLRFEDLRVFKLAEKLCDDIWGIVTTWEYFEKNTVGVQIVKAADSIGANIAEGAGRGTAKDNKRFIRISRGSLNETKYWIRRATRRSLMNDNQSALLRTTIEELGPSLNAYLNSIGRGKQVQTPNTKHEMQNTNHAQD